MRAWALGVVGAGILGVGACTPFTGGTFECTEDSQCDQLVDGQCDLLSGFCTYADSACGSGRSYGDFSGGLSGVCVGEEPDAGANGPDANTNLPDADPNRPDAGCDPGWDPQFFEPCSVVFPTGPLDMPDGVYTYDTDAGSLTHDTLGGIPHANQTITPPGGPEVRIVVADSISLGSTATLRATGTRPLMLVSWSTMTIDGLIDVSSGAGPGAGANPTECSGHAPTVGTSTTNGGGGGGGAGFQNNGGGGGTGGSSGDGVGGAAGGTVATPTFIRGGCRGATGGAGDQTAVQGGHGGGAVHLVAHDSIAIAGRISAGGAGGAGANLDGGGGGGGSGGYMSFEAPSMTVGGGAILAANGGGGGGGADTIVAPAGQNGQLSATAATGGSVAGGGPGGDGGVQATPNGSNGTNSADGAGGGGGAVGFVIFYGTPAINGGATVSPAQTQL